ncbi:hypothetical protein RO1_41500 [Roseburia intestinalis XB6B4]|uniref:Uncharacterized protein n=1 Tax=Roseburia intestinalis XB6B4 TaxID=718255 RepID=D4L3Y8_9FIRM|nr:hypothetical protein RO1_41500 [Roseburia intestinalis XB6B4]
MMKKSNVDKKSNKKYNVKNVETTYGG